MTNVKQITEKAKINRQHKDRLFRMIFHDKKDL